MGGSAHQYEVVIKWVIDMGISKRELEQQAELMELANPDLGDRLVQVCRDLESKERQYEAYCEGNTDHSGPAHDKLAAELEAAAVAMVAFLDDHGYVYREVRNPDLWGIKKAVHPLYAEVYDAGLYDVFLGWYSKVGKVPSWAIATIRPPLFSKIEAVTTVISLFDKIEAQGAIDG